MKHTNRNKKNTRKINKKRNITISKKRGGGGFDEPMESQMLTIKNCFPEFYKPTEDTIGEINISLASLGIDIKTLNVTEKRYLVEKYEMILKEYVKAKRDMFFAAINHLINPKKNNDSTHPNQNIVPTLCCISLIEKIKAISELAKRDINQSFNPNHIDKSFLEKVEKTKNTQDIRILETFLEKNGISRPIVSNTGKTKTDREKALTREEALTIYINDLIKIFNSLRKHKIVDDMLIYAYDIKIQDIQTKIQERENIKKEQEKHTQDQKNKLHSIILNVKGTGGLFGEARKTLPYFSNKEKIDIIEKLSSKIADLLRPSLETESDNPDFTSIIDDTLIDILDKKYDNK